MDVTQFVDAGVTVLSRDNEICVICILDNDVAIVLRSHVGRSNDLCGWPYAGSLHNTGGYGGCWRQFISESHAMRTPAEKILHPIEYLVWNV